MGAIFYLDIPASEKLVLLAMADHARDDGTGCYPSIRLLAQKTSQTRRGVQKIVARLESRGLLVGPPIERRKGGRDGRGRGISTEYQIVVENGERGSLFTPQQGRTTEQTSANASAGRANVEMQKGEHGSPESSRTVSEPSNQNPTRFALPDWVPQPAWNDFLEMRKSLRATPTEKAKALLVRQLEKLKAEGHDPQAVLEQSVERGWKGLFELSGQKTRKGVSFDGRKQQSGANGGYHGEPERDKQPARGVAEAFNQGAKRV
jgi:hypothetical protein